MPSFIGGLPLHPLVVHATVVLVPVAVLGSLLVVLWPAARRRYGSLVVVTAVLGTVCTVVAEQTGEALEHSLPHDPATEMHAAAGDYLKLWMAPLMIAVAIFVLMHRHADRLSRREAGTTSALALARRQRVVAVAVAVVTAVLALGTAAVVFQTGDLGARAVWGERVYEQR